MTPDEKVKSTCVFHPLVDGLVKEIKAKQDSRPCAAQQVEINHLKASDTAQWVHIDRLNRSIWFAAGAAFMGSALAQVLVGYLLKR